MEERKIPNFREIRENTTELTETINSYYWAQFKHTKYRCIFVRIEDVYVPSIFMDNFNKIKNYSKEIVNYSSGFKKGYFNFLDETPTHSQDFKDAVFSRVTNLNLPADKFFIYPQDEKYYEKIDSENKEFAIDSYSAWCAENRIPINLEKWGELMGAYYCAWCILINKQRYFEPLFKEYNNPDVKYIGFKTDYSEKCLTEIHSYLTKLQYQDKPTLDTSLNNWLAWFDFRTIDNISTMKWNGAKGILPSVIYHICGEIIEKTIIEAFGLKEKKLNYNRKDYEDAKSTIENPSMYKKINQIINKK